MVMIKYVSEGEYPAMMTLDSLLANFAYSGADTYNTRKGVTQDEVRYLVTTRGWYAGQHMHGQYLILNLDMLDLRPVVRSPAGLRRIKWSFDWPQTEYIGWTDDTRWNGFLNVAIDPLTRDELVVELQDHAVDEDDRTIASDIAALPIKDGLVWLRDGWSISEVTMD